MSAATIKPSLRATNMDQLVATYAPIGMRQRLRRRIRRALIAGGAIVGVGVCALLSRSDVLVLDSIRGVLPSVASTISQQDASRLLRERSEFAANIAELERQIASVQTQKLMLESQQAEFAEKSALLEHMLQAADSQQTDLERRQQQGSVLDQEIAAIAAQRIALESRWAQFEAQGELLAVEIIAVNTQRKELESQRHQIDQQQQRLAEMLERADGLDQRNAKSSDVVPPMPDATTTSTEQNAFTYTNNSLLVNSSELDSMRGGFSVGDGLDVSFGYLQTGSIDGVEQFSNSFSIDSFSAGFGNVDMSNMNSVLLQNGSGNIVSAGVLDALSNSFGSIMQNTLDDQVLSTTTVLDISLHNVPGTLQGLAGEQALMDSLGSFR